MDVMIDLETLGTASDTVVLSIGAVEFDVKTKKLGRTFYCELPIQSQINMGRSITAATLNWWMKQEGSAQAVLDAAMSCKDNLDVLVNDFHTFLGTSRPLSVWGNGATFDISILESLFKDVNLKAPWAFTHVMDLRTFRRFVAKGKKVEVAGVKHNALDDSIAQAKYVMEYYNESN